jgi:hypothetical protein
VNILFGVYWTMDDNSSTGVYNGLRKEGHDVTVFPRFAVRQEAVAAKKDPGAYVLERFIARVKLLEIDVVLARKLTDYFPHVEDIATFRDACPDTKLVDLSQYHPYALWKSIVGDMSEVAKTAAFDLLLCQCHNSIKAMEGFGARASYYPSFATSLLWGHAGARTSPRLSCDVVMPWNAIYPPEKFPTHISRKGLVDAFLNGGITHIRIYGGDVEPTRNLWLQADPEFGPYVRPSVDVRGIAMVMRAAKITLSTSVISENPVISPRGYWSTRIPTAMLSNSLLLADTRASITAPWVVDGEEIALVDGEHLVTYDDEDDAVEKARYYLDNEDERREIVEAANTFAVAHLTEEEVVPKLILPAIEALF